MHRCVQIWYTSITEETTTGQSDRGIDFKSWNKKKVVHAKPKTIGRRKEKNAPVLFCDTFFSPCILRGDSDEFSCVDCSLLDTTADARSTRIARASWSAWRTRRPPFHLCFSFFLLSGGRLPLSICPHQEGLADVQLLVEAGPGRQQQQSVGR